MPHLFYGIPEGGQHHGKRSLSSERSQTRVIREDEFHRSSNLKFIGCVRLSVHNREAAHAYSVTANHRGFVPSFPKRQLTIPYANLFQSVAA